MRVSFNQPAFIPWGGFFARLLSSDKMVLLDGTALARGFTYVNRNRLKGPEGEVWITVPLKRKGRGTQRIRDLEIDEKEKWARKFLLTLKHYYGKSIYFDSFFPDITAALKEAGDDFLRLVLSLIEVVRKGLGIDTNWTLQSELGVSARGTPLLVSVAKELGAEEVLLPYFSEKIVDCRLFAKEKIRVRLLRYLPPQYPQFWGDFLMNLSALDLLLCCGPSGRAVLVKGSRLMDLASPQAST
ncbi:MAG: WbqC family protein [Candidatus Aminicenantales bacterium]